MTDPPHRPVPFARDADRLLDSATVVGDAATSDDADAVSPAVAAGDRETSIRRSLEVLLSLGSEAAIESGGLGVTRIADLLGREKSQVSRTLKTLATFGLVDRDPDSLAYRLGWRIYALASLAGDRRLLDLARPILRQLVDSFEERAFLSILQGSATLTLLSESAPTSLQASGWVGRETPAYCTSVGQVLLFDEDEAGLKRVFGGVTFRQLGPGTPRSLDDLAGRIARSRERGYAIADEEMEPGLVAAAAPVRDPSGRIVAALNVSGPKFRLGTRLDEAGAALVLAAADLSAALAGRPDTPTA
jgi:IclR family transcriptional regulator, KDG regulon repressor